MMIKPPKLSPGATIGILSPSYWFDESDFQITAKIFEERGYQLLPGKTTRLKNNLYAGSPEERAREIMNLFMNPQVDAIICTRGGYGANRVLKLLDYQLIQQHPKIFIGYSDITAYLISITQKSGLVTFHGPMLTTFKEEVIDYNLENFEKVLSGESGIRIDSPPDLPCRILKDGIAEGPLWGGNLTLIINRLATRGQLDMDGIILFLEDIDEYFYALDRQLYHLRITGSLDNIRGLIVGEMIDIKDTKIPFGKTVDEIVMDVCGDLDIPIISNFPCGHGRHQVTFPISIPVKLNAVKNNPPYIELLESPVN